MLDARVIITMSLLCAAISQNCAGEDALTRARREVAVRNEVTEAIKELRESGRIDGERAREKVLAHLTLADQTLAALRSALDRWRDHVEPLLTSDAGRRLASDTELRYSFVSVYSEFVSEYAELQANCHAAEQLSRETRKFLTEHNEQQTSYTPSYDFTRRLNEVFDELESPGRKFEAAVTRIELWTQITANRDVSKYSLRDYLKPAPTDSRSASAIGKDLISIRNLGYARAAEEFAATLTKEAGLRQGAEQVRTIGVLTGKLVSNRNQPTQSVTIQIKERTRSRFTGSMFLNTGDEVSRVSGQISGDQFQCRIGTRSGVLELTGTIRSDEVNGSWKSSGRGRNDGTFRFSLTRIESDDAADKSSE